MAVKDVSPAEAAALLPQYTYLDVRTPTEFAAGHAPGATNIPVCASGPSGMSPIPSFVSDVKAAFPDKAALIIVACKAGGRSAQAVSKMEAAYTGLVHMRGGWDAWMAAGLPVEK